MLKRKVTASEYEELDDAVKAYYKESGKDYVLDVEDDGSAAKLKEFRENNIKLMKQMEELREQADALKDIDPDKAREALAKMRELEESKLLEAGEVDKLVEKRTEEMRKEYENKIKALNDGLQEKDSELQSTSNRLSEILIDSEVSRAVGEVGTVRKGALSDVMSRARSMFTLKDGEPVALRDGNIVYSAKDPNKPMTISEWAGKLPEDAPHLFEDSKGGGGRGNERTGQPPGSKSIDAGDRAGFSKNLEGIAKGEVTVRQSSG